MKARDIVVQQSRPGFRIDAQGRFLSAACPWAGQTGKRPPRYKTEFELLGAVQIEYTCNVLIGRTLSLVANVLLLKSVVGGVK